MVDLSRIVIYHDAFLQHGGAEKVALEWAAHLHCPVVTLAKSKYFFWESDNVIISKLPFIQTHRVLRILFPAIPVILKILKFESDELRLVSTTGLAHYFGGGWKHRIVYMHSPSRWIWNKEEIEKDFGLLTKIVMSFFRPIFKRYDRKKLHNQDILIANSRATASRIEQIYKRKAPVIFPPVSMKILQPIKPKGLDQDCVFFLSIGRRKSYKGFSDAIDACSRANVKLVLVGEGSSIYQSNSIFGLGYVTSEELSWLFQNAQALLATGSEDFGLTPVEAAMNGCPTLAYPRRGYFDSVRNGVSGEILPECSVAAMSLAIKKFSKHRFKDDQMKAFAAEFSIDTHVVKLLKVFSEFKIEKES